MIVLIVLGVGSLVAAGVVALFHLGASTAVSFAIVGLALLAASLFRRKGKPGDFNRSGWTGQ